MASGVKSFFAQHIEETVASIASAPNAMAVALIRERAAEARHIAERLRAKAAEVPAFVTAAKQLEDRATLLDAVAKAWPAPLPKETSNAR